jgi:hypothetical protein
MANTLKSNQSKVDVATGYPIYMVQDLQMEFSKQWAINFVQRAYGNRSYIVDLKNLREFRDLDRGIINVKALKNSFDKQGKDNPISEDKLAEYVNTDWYVCPLFQSLNQITKGYILDELAEIQVNGLDRISHDKKLRERHRNATKRYTIDYFNFIGSLTNEAPLPYTTNISKLLNDKEESSTLGEGVSMIEQIKTELDDDPSYAMLSDIGALKDGVESSHEQMIKYFMETENFHDIISDDIVKDIMHVRAFCYRVYTSAKDGTLKYHYCDLATINVSPFKLKDGSDIDYIFEEFVVTWSQFMDMVGAKLSVEELRRIYEANRNGYNQANRNYPEWNAGVDYDNNLYNRLNNTSIRLGYMELKKQIHDPNNGKYYDVIKKFYYLPIFGTGYLLKSEDIVFDIGNLQDMSRYGGMLEMAKFSYVIMRDDAYQSWYEIQRSNLNLLNILYNQYQNTVNGIVPRGLMYAEETLRELVEDMIRSKEEHMRETGQEIGNMDGEFQKLLRDVIKRVEQSGKGIFKRKTGDANEKSIDPPTFTIEHHLYEDLRELMTQILGVCNMMIMSLGTNPQMLGQAPRPRQAVRGLEISSQSGLTMLQEMVGMFNFGLKEFGTRVIYYDQQVIQEFDKNTMQPKTPRAEQMKGVLGDLGTNWMEIYNDMPIQKCGIVIQIKPTAEERIMLFDYAMQMEQMGKLPIGTALMTKEFQNPKLAYLWMMATAKRQERIMVDNQVQAQQAQQQAMQQQFQMQQALQQQAIAQQAQIKAQQDAQAEALKTQGQLQVKDKTNQNRLQENQQVAELEMQQQAQEKSLESL